MAKFQVALLIDRKEFLDKALPRDPNVPSITIQAVDKGDEPTGGEVDGRCQVTVVVDVNSMSTFGDQVMWKRFSLLRRWKYRPQRKWEVFLCARFSLRTYPFIPVCSS